MRRAPIVLAFTVLGTAGVLLFKPLPTSAVAGSTDAVASDGSTSTSTSPAPSASSSTRAPSSTSASSSTTAKDGTYTGAAETTRFGTTQVRVTIAGGRITEVAVVRLNQDDPRSTQISQDAAPLLRTEVLAKQTAAVDVISGATYTTDAYEASLQSALDRAGYTAPDGSKASTDVSSIEG